MTPKETVIEIKVIVDETRQKIQMKSDKNAITPFELLGVFRYLEKTTYLNMINEPKTPEINSPNQNQVT